MILLKYRYSRTTGGTLWSPFQRRVKFVLPVVDWDERRALITFGEAPADEMEHEKDEEYTEKLYAALRDHRERLTPDTWKLHLTSAWKVDTEEGDVGDGIQPLVCFYPHIQDYPGLARHKSISRSRLVEVERLDAQIDLCYYQTPQQPSKMVVFKYCIVHESLPYAWNELQIYSSIPSHPFLAPFDRIVVAEQDEPRIVGFTVDHIPGGNMADHPRSLIKLGWLQQLMQVVDDLNLLYGVWHRDIHPRNILIDPDRDAIQLIDFNFAGRFGEWFRGHNRPEDATRADPLGVAFTLYEWITRDYTHRDGVWDFPDVEVILGMEKWQVHGDVSLDQDISIFRQELSSWLSKRRTHGYIQDSNECPEDIGPPPKCRTRR